MYAMGRGSGPLWSDDGRLPKMEGSGVLQDLIPDVQKLVFPQIPVEGRVIDSYEHHLLDGPGNPVWFHANNGETVHTDAVPCSMTMLLNGGGSSKMLLKSVPKGPPKFPMYSSSQSIWVHLIQYIMPLFGQTATTVKPTTTTLS